MGPEQKRLQDRLFGDPAKTLRNFRITPGNRPMSSEELCAAVNKVMDEIERRRAAGVPNDDPPMSGRPRMTRRELLKPQS